MVFLNPLWSLKASVPIYCNSIEKSNQNTLIKTKSCWLGLTWKWVNYNWIIISGWTISLIHSSLILDVLEPGSMTLPFPMNLTHITWMLIGLLQVFVEVLRKEQFLSGMKRSLCLLCLIKCHVGSMWDICYLLSIMALFIIVIKNKICQ